MLEDKTALLYGKKHTMLRNGEIFDSKWKAMEYINSLCADDVFMDGELVSARYYGDSEYLDITTTNIVCSDTGIYPGEETAPDTINTLMMRVTPGEWYRIVCENKGDKFLIFEFDNYVDPQLFTNDTPIRPTYDVDMSEQQSDNFDYLFQVGENTNMICVKLASANCDTVKNVSGHFDCVMACLAECIKDTPTETKRMEYFDNSFEVIQGILGIQGVQGIKGAQGFIGIQGPAGDAGEQGAQGAQGFVGEVGFKGVQGVIGAQGENGEQGAQGERGAQGEPGFQGIIGFQGEANSVQGAANEIGRAHV